LGFTAVAEENKEDLSRLIQRFLYMQGAPYRVWYSLHAPDRPWEEIERRISKKRIKHRKRLALQASLLYYAAFGVLQQTVGILLGKGADVNAQCGEYGNPLQAASQGGHEQVVKLLLDKGANVNAKDVCNRTPLLCAAANGGLSSVQLLLANDNIQPDMPDVLFGQSPLSWAAKRGHMSVSKLLISNPGVNPDAKDPFGRTPLWLAAANGYKGVVELLLSRCNFDPWSKDVFRFTLLLLVAERGEHGILDLLRQACTKKSLTPCKIDPTAIWPQDACAKLCTKCLPSIRKCQGDFKVCMACVDRRTFWLE
jgi:ankyrin repeat protein